MENIQYKKKLELSYKIVLGEMVNPTNWEDIIKRMKYKMDPSTGALRTEVEIPLTHADNIELRSEDDKTHTYIFKRSHFYNKNKRLRYEMENVWNARGYYVKLIKPDFPNTVWKLKLAWNYKSG